MVAGWVTGVRGSEQGAELEDGRGGGWRLQVPEFKGVETAEYAGARIGRAPA